MANNDPFNTSTSPFGSRPKRVEDSAAPAAQNTPPAFPQIPKPGQGKVSVPLPTRPDFRKDVPAEKATLPSLPTPQISTDKEPALPAFSPSSNKPQRGTSNDLFGNTPDPVEEEDFEDYEDELDEDDYEEELSDEETYEVIFEEEMPEDFNPDDDITDEEDLYLANIFEAAATPVGADQTLYALLSNPNWQVRMALADNVEIPSTILAKLAEDEDENVRQSVMENPNCPDDIYVNFAFDEDELLVADWIEMDRTTSEMLTPLHKTEDYTIGASLVESGKIPFSVKLELERKLNK